MKKVEVFFDLTCPYCYRGLACLKELLPQFPDAEVIWRPVEAHPKIEEPGHKPYADLTVQGCLFVIDAGGDALKYIDNVFHAYFEEKQAPDDISVLTQCTQGCGIDTDAFRQALSAGKFEKAGHDANDYAYEQRGVWAVPAFVSLNTGTDADKRLDAVGGVGVTRQQLNDFLKSL